MPIAVVQFAMERLVDLALKLGSSDNITALVVPLL
jgi:serine/threonine protein phosphatase PrpC